MKITWQALPLMTHPRPKIRLDQHLVNLGLCSSKSQAQGYILAGKVLIDGEVVDKPGTQYSATQLEKLTFEIDQPNPYVSRGGFKLAKALSTFNINPSGKTCLDVGASTGGFTDCLLQNGAKKVYAVDVGYGQLAWSLRQHPNVIVMEKTNIKTLTHSDFSEAIELVVIDVSFISLKKVLPTVCDLLIQPNTPIIALLKPQFEYLDYLPTKGFDGVVRGIDHHRLIINSVIAELQTTLPSLELTQLDCSPIKGPKGNIEFLLSFVLKPPIPQFLSTEALNIRFEQLYGQFEENQASESR